MVILSFPVLIFERKLFNKYGIWICEVRELKNTWACAPDVGSMKVDSQVSPLALPRFWDTVDSADVEGHELFWVDWYENGFILLVNI